MVLVAEMQFQTGSSRPQASHRSVSSYGGEADVGG